MTDSTLPTEELVRLRREGKTWNEIADLANRSTTVVRKKVRNVMSDEEYCAIAIKMKSLHSGDRPYKVDDNIEQAVTYRREGMTLKEICRRLGLDSGRLGATLKICMKPGEYALTCHKIKSKTCRGNRNAAIRQTSSITFDAQFQNAYCKDWISDTSRRIGAYHAVIDLG